MRLVCPNCAAQYEVDDSVIPSGGRDVQCSNCGNAWFQPGPYDSEETSEAAGDDGQWADDADDGTGEADVIAAVARQVPEASTDPDDDDIVPPPPAVERRQIDPSALDVLREEAERETLARRAEGIPALETQEEFSLTDAEISAGIAAATGAAAHRMSDDGTGPTAGGMPDGAVDAEDGAAVRGPRRGLLPDIEEINSTLSASSGRSHGGEAVLTAETMRRRKSGFRMGFSLSLLTAAGLLILYLFAPAIEAKVPALQPALERYVAGVNDVRQWIDDKMKSSTEALRDKPAAPGG